MPPYRHRLGLTLVELLVVIAIVGILVALLLPAVNQAREAARRTECQSNLRQIGIALHQFEGVHRVFPASGWTEVGPGNPLGKAVGWRVSILPFIEQENVRTLYDDSQNWWEGTNPSVAAIPIDIFLCPSTAGRMRVDQAIAKPPRPAMSFSSPLAPTDYEALMGVKPKSINLHLPEAIYTNRNRFAVMHRNSTTTFGSMTDGSSNTIMVTECAGRPLVMRGRRAQPGIANDQGISWADSEGAFSLDGARLDGSAEGCGPADGCVRAMNARNDNEPYSFHPQICQFLFADGHVGKLGQDTELVVLAALATRSAGEVTSAGAN